ncbi:hypothetical protein [Mucilaginibacter xinganensis]|uniref:Uncharacterized protein n=1 Tax=Mucilaginibacter xinganensis TaxID=1234841 RepID=A0A223NUY5_9SPHI|nr:hypothetical protein [Mucilaginibacter xinganensis]ASU33570.1 hypothetical protein MuYL_1674 [Mucilaginibacter xinganensis]
MIKIELTPLKGIDIENVGEVLLGQSRQSVDSLLGKPSEPDSTNSAFYELYELRIDFDEFGKVGYIEFLYGPFPERTELCIYDVNPFTIGAEKLVEILSRQNNGEIDTTEAEFSYAFLNISVGIWRQFTQKDMEESIAELKSTGKYEFNRSSIEDDLDKSRNFWTIGVGVANYYK